MNILQYYYNKKLVSLNIYIIPKKEIKSAQKAHTGLGEKKSIKSIYLESTWSLCGVYVEYVESKWRLEKYSTTMCNFT
jgi:hypothetical protein